MPEVNDMDNSVIGSCCQATPVRRHSMLFHVKSRSEDDFGVLELSGPLTLSPALSSLREAARKILVMPKISGLILQVSAVTTADSAGLGELTIVYTFASKRACPLRLVGATPGLRKMLEMTRLDDLFQFVDSVLIAKKQMRP
jgi:anti-anti-sigma factor